MEPDSAAHARYGGSCIAARRSEEARARPGSACATAARTGPMMGRVATGRRPAPPDEEVTMRLRVLSLLSCLALLAAMVSAAAAFEEKNPAAKSRPDAWVAAKAKVVLWTDNDV